MGRISILFLSTLVFILLSYQAQASSICNRFNTPGQERQFANCQMIFRSHLVPNKSALEYTIRYWTDNRDRLRDPSCAVQGMGRSTGCDSCRNESWVRGGFENQCTFVINDLNRPWTRQPARRRTTAYYIDLCTSDRSKVVRSFYMNGGTGTRFDDTPDRGRGTSEINKSTLAGAFKLEGRIYQQRETYSPAAYQGIMQRHGGTIPMIYMKGLNSSNNQTEADKPIHMSPFRSSWGCPSVSEATGDLLFNEMTSRGSTLYMAYAGPSFEQRGDSCNNSNVRSGSSDRRSQNTRRGVR